MNQAIDKLGYSGEAKGSLPIAKLRAHAERCSDSVLDGLFGKKRLLFVSTLSIVDFKAKRKVKVERRWLPRALDRCVILAELVKTLTNQRSLECHQFTYADCVDKTGNLFVYKPDDNDDEAGERMQS